MHLNGVPRGYVRDGWHVPQLRCALAVACVVAGAVVPQMARATSFSQALEQIADTHPRLNAAADTARAGYYDVDAVKAARMPHLSITGDAGYRRSDLGGINSGNILSPGVQASQLLYDGGRTNAEIRRRSSRAKELDVGRDDAFERLAVQLSEAWGEWARQKALYAIASQQVAALESLHRTVKDIAGFDRGRASDVSLVATRLAQAVNSRDSRSLAADDALGSIRRITISPVLPDGDLPPVEGLLPRSVDMARGRVAEGPAVRIAALKRDQAAANADSAGAYWKPNISLNASSYSLNDITGRQKPFGVVEVKLRSSLSAFDGGAGRAGKNAANSQLSSANLEYRFIREEAEAEVERLWTLINERKARIATLEALIAETDQSRDIVFEQFRIGRRSILDLLSFEIDRFGARASLESERRDLIQSEYRLLGAMGATGRTLLPSWQSAADTTGARR